MAEVYVYQEHPGWLLRLVGAVEQYENLHSKVDSDDDWSCLGEALKAVPDRVRAQALGYLQGRRDAGERTDA